MSPWQGWEDYKPPYRVSGEANNVAPQPKRSKYNATRTKVDGFTFDSKREAERYALLLVQQRAGEIAELELQPRFALHALTPQGALVVIGEYIADFAYRRAGASIVEDAKGVRTAIYAWKRKHVMAEYGIDVVEI